MPDTCLAVWVLVFSCFIPAFLSDKLKDATCRLHSSDLHGSTLPGDTMIGLIIPLHLDKTYKQVSFTEKPPKTVCTMFQLENYQMLQTTVFALEQINNDPNLLPNMTLGLQVYDSCDAPHLDLQGTLQMLTGVDWAIPNYRCLPKSTLTAVLGASHSTHSIAMAHILGLTRHPQISQFSTSPLLSDRTKFPSFFRIVPSDTFQSHGLARLVLYYGWSWVGLLSADNDYGQYGIQLVKQELIKAGACVEYIENILMSRPDRNAPHIVKVIKRSTAKVVVVFCNDVDFMPILNEWLKQNVSKKIFIASDAWSTTNIFSIEKFSELLYGTIGFAFSSGTLPGLKEFLNKVQPFVSFGGEWTKIFWEHTFNCTYVHDRDNKTSQSQPDLIVKQCTGTENLQNTQNSYTDVSSLRPSYNAYTAVHVVVNALEDLRRCQEGNGPFSMSSCANKQKLMPWQLLHYMKRVKFRLNSGRELHFDENGDPHAVYDIVNWKLTAEGVLYQAKVGSYDTVSSSGEIFAINTSSILWAIEDHQVSRCSESCLPGFRKAARGGQPICCYECVPCPPGEISNQTDSVVCFKCPTDEWPNSENSQCLLKTIEYLSYEDSLGTTLTAMSLGSFLVPISIMKLFIRHKKSPLVKANNYYISCLLLISLSMCFLCPLMFIGYPKPETCLLQQVTFGMTFALCISCVLAKTLIVIFAFMATKPDLWKWTNPMVSYLVIFKGSFLQLILCIAWLSLTPPFLQRNTQSKTATIIIECNEGSSIAFWTMLGYLFLLATISFIVAFLARRLPNSFNEAQYITFSMLAFISVWVSYIPASLSAQGKYIVTMEIFAICASSWALVICMFFPKCVIILFRPEMNVREFLVRSSILKK
ncbi:extracellular calcium-sensing receptor-like [Bufo bufo]|uniref:extracellular calcium-sensing receptor-like n=1 Tax=Bufo bufo TaxID=8384 RepID=UPI001ABE7453|nr:extracellular calcium-sensing receptor-like [Bufo bufo]